MFAPRVKQWIGTGVVLAAMAIGGCARADRAPTAASEPKTLLSVAQARSAMRRSMTADGYVRANPMGWTGQAHNRFLTEALAKTVKLRTPAERCAAIGRVLQQGRWLGADASRFGQGMRRRYSDQAQSSYVGCRRSNGGDDRNVAYRKAMMSVSDITPFTDAIAAAIPSATSSDALAATLSVITDSAASVLSGDDLMNVYSAAAFTVSSAQYWEQNGDWQVDAMASGGMGDCIGQTMSADGCVYASRGPVRRSTVPTFRLASLKTPLTVTPASGWCPYRWNGWTVTSADLGGFMGGLMTVSVGGGVFVGAVASVSAFTAEAGREVYCRMTHAQ